MHRLRGQIAAREGELRFEVRSEFWAYRFGQRSNRLEWLGRTRGAHIYPLAVVGQRVQKGVRMVKSPHVSANCDLVSAPSPGRID